MSKIIRFDEDIAEIVGVNAAVIYEAIRYWSNENEKKQINYNDEKYWVFHSVEEWSNMFSFLTKGQVRVAIKKLEESGLILSCNYNKFKYDKTKWYSINNDTNGLLNNATRKAERNQPIQLKNNLEEEEVKGLFLNQSNNLHNLIDFIDYIKSNFIEMDINIKGHKYYISKAGILKTTDGDERVTVGMAKGIYKYMYENKGKVIDYYNKVKGVA